MSKLPGAKWDERAGAATNARRELPQLAASFFTQVRALPPTIRRAQAAPAQASTKRLRTRWSCSSVLRSRAGDTSGSCTAFNSRWEK